MQILSKTMKIAAAAIALLVLAGGAAQAQDKPKVFAGTIKIDSTQLAFIISGKVGGGVLTFQGKTYDFDLAGLGVGGIGIKKIDAVGTVYNMTEISQFPGFYTEIKAGIAVVSGTGVMSLGNKAGVMIELKDSGAGLALDTGVDGLTIKMSK